MLKMTILIWWWARDGNGSFGTIDLLHPKRSAIYRIVQKPSQKVMVKLKGWIIESNAFWVKNLLRRILVSHSRNSHLQLFIKVMMTNLECKIKSLLGKISDDACKVSPPEACHSFMGISSCDTVSDPTVTLLKSPLFEQFPLVL